MLMYSLDTYKLNKNVYKSVENTSWQGKLHSYLHGSSYPILPSDKIISSVPNNLHIAFSVQKIGIYMSVQYDYFWNFRSTNNQRKPHEDSFIRV